MTRQNETEVLRAQRLYQPLIDVLELEDRYEVRADLPGSRPDDIDVRFEFGVLAIHAKVAPRRREEPTDEYGTGDWKLALQFGDLVDADRLDASYRLGVLTVTLAKANSMRRRRVDVRSN